MALETPGCIQTALRATRHRGVACPIWLILDGSQITCFVNESGVRGENGGGGGGGADAKQGTAALCTGNGKRHFAGTQSDQSERGEMDQTGLRRARCIPIAGGNLLLRAHTNLGLFRKLPQQQEANSAVFVPPLFSRRSRASLILSKRDKTRRGAPEATYP
ncbi:unnamed protein product [Ixodes pacificus]